MCSPEERRGVCNYMKAFSPPIQELICAFCFSFERICLQGFATTMAKLVDPGDSCHREKAFRKLSLCECIVQRKKKEQKLMPFACSRSKITALDKFDHDLTDNPLLEWVCCLRDVSPNGRTIQSSNLLKFIVPIFIAIVCFISITFPNHISRRQSSSPKRNAKPEWSNCFFLGGATVPLSLSQGKSQSSLFKSLLFMVKPYGSLIIPIIFPVIPLCVVKPYG